MTFVYDNSDHNPESLSDSSMHVTNGILIQLSDQLNVQQNNKNEVNIRKSNSFTVIDVDIAHYKQADRSCPQSLGYVNKDENLLDQYLAMKADLLWLILRRQSQLFDHDQSVPAWTGFNYRIRFLMTLSLIVGF